MSCCATKEPVDQPTGVSAPSARQTGGAVEAPPAPRRLYYGWVMLPLAIMALVASAPGQTFGVSIFNEPMRRSLGLSHSQLAAAYMLGTLLGAIPITLVGRQMDRYGLRRTMMAVVGLFSGACVFTAFVQGWFSLVVAFALLRMLGPGALGLLSGATMAFWFDRRLGAVEGLRQLGMAGAMTLIPALNLHLVHVLGWRGAYAALGIALLAALLPAFAVLFRNRPEEVGQSFNDHAPAFNRRRGGATAGDAPTAWEGLTLAETLGTRAFWIAAGGSGLFGMIHTAVFFCLVPIFQEQGLSASAAAATLTSFAALLAIMQLVGGVLADRLPAPRLLATGLCGLSLSMVLLPLVATPATAIAIGAGLGAAQGLYFGTLHPLWARYFGRRHLGKIRGVLMTINVGSSSLGPLLASLVHDATGGFRPALMLFALLPLPVAALSLFASRPERDADAIVAMPRPDMA